jgi:hypothetical protein
MNCWVVSATDAWASVCDWAGYHGPLRERRIGDAKVERAMSSCFMEPEFEDAWDGRTRA